MIGKVEAPAGGGEGILVLLLLLLVLLLLPMEGEGRLGEEEKGLQGIVQQVTPTNSQEKGKAVEEMAGTSLIYPLDKSGHKRCWIVSEVILLLQRARQVVSMSRNLQQNTRRVREVAVMA